MIQKFTTLNLHETKRRANKTKSQQYISTKAKQSDLNKILYSREREVLSMKNKQWKTKPQFNTINLQKDIIQKLTILNEKKESFIEN